MEIERKFLVEKLPEMPAAEAIHIEQGYISTDPVIRIRSWNNGREQRYILTVKGGGMIVREEYELEITSRQFEGLKEKCTGRFIDKTRYIYPLENGLKAEVDVFGGTQQGLILAEVEFLSEDGMREFQKPEWFGEEVSQDPRYHNSNMTRA